MHPRGSTRPRGSCKDQSHAATSPRLLPDSAAAANRTRFPTPTSSSSSPMRTSGRSVRPRLPASLSSPHSSASSSSSRKPSSPNGKSKESPIAKVSNSLVLFNNVGSLRSPTDKSSLPAFYCEPVSETTRITTENPKSYLDTLKSDIANVLKKTSDEVEYHYPVGLVETPGQPLEFLKGSRNINNVKELNNLLEEVRSENFKLKLKLFYHEEKNKSGNSVENNLNINLKVELEQTKLELARRNELLKETLLFLNSLGKDKEKINSPRLSEASVKTTSEDESLTSQVNCWTTSEDSIAFHVRDKDCLKNVFDKLMDEAKSVTPNLKSDIEYISTYFTHAINRASGCGEDIPNSIPIMDGEALKMSQRIAELEAELKKYRDEAAIPTRDNTPTRHETEQELRMLHQAYSEKDRLYQDAIKDKCLFLKETEDHYKSILAVAKERSDEVNRLNKVMQKMEIDMKNTKHTEIEDKSEISKLQEEIKEAKIALEQEIANNYRIVSEAEVLDRIQNEQSEELSKLKKNLSDFDELQRRQLNELKEKENIISKLELKLKEATNSVQHLQSKIIILEDKNLTEKEALQEEIEMLKRNIKSENQLNKDHRNNNNASSSKISLSFTKNDGVNQRKSDGDLRCKEAELFELRQLYKEAAKQISILEHQLSEKSLRLEEVKKQNHPKFASAKSDLSGSYIEMSGLSSKKQNENISEASVLQPQKNIQFGQSSDVNQLKEEIGILLLKIQQLEVESGNKLYEQGLINSFQCEASTIHNVDCSHSLLAEQQSSFAEFLNRFQGSATDRLLLNHIYELQLFLQKLIMNEDVNDLSQEFSTSVNIQHIKKLLVDIDRTLDESQNETSILLLEKTFKSLPVSMENVEASQTLKSESESNGTSKDRDMSIMSSHSYTKDIEVSVVDDALKDNSNFKENTLAKGEKIGNCEVAEDLILKDITSETTSSNISFKNCDAHDINSNRVMRRRWSSSPFPQLPDPSTCFQNSSDHSDTSDSGTCPLSLFSENGGSVSNFEIIDTRRNSSNNLEANCSDEILKTQAASRQRPLLLPMQSHNSENIKIHVPVNAQINEMAKRKRTYNYAASRCYACGQVAAINNTSAQNDHVMSPLPSQQRANWVQERNCHPATNTSLPKPVCSTVLPYYCNISSESDIWSEPDRAVSLGRMGINSNVLLSSFSKLDPEGCTNGISFFEPKRSPKRVCHFGNSCKHMRQCVSLNCCCAQCRTGLQEKCLNKFHKCCVHAKKDSTSTSSLDSGEMENSNSGFCFFARSQFQHQRKDLNNHVRGSSSGTKVKRIPTSNPKELELLVRRIENSVESILREFSKYNNENPSLVLQLLDTLKEHNGDQLSSLLKGQILNAFEMLGEKMDSLSTRTKEVYSAISALNTHLSLFNTSKTDFQKSSFAKQLSSTLNIQSTNNESQNFVPVDQRVCEDRVLQERETNLLHELSSDIHSVNAEVTKDRYNLEVLRDFNNQLVESLRSSLDWVKSINDTELSDIIEKQGVENILSIGGQVNREISPTSYAEEVTRLNAMLPNWVHLNRMLYQITAKSLRDKKQALKASEEQVGNFKSNLDMKFKDLKQVQDWNLRLQNELDFEKAALTSTQDRLTSVQEAFEVASAEVKSKMEENAKIWEENKILKRSIESNASDSSALKELCNKQKEKIKELKLQKENVEFQLDKLKGEFDSWISKMDNEQKLKNDYVNQIQILKEEIQHLVNSRNGIELDKNELISNVADLRKEVDKHRETEKYWLASYNSLEIELNECKTKLETLVASKDSGLLSKGNVGSDLHNALSNNANLEEDCKLLGERLNEVQKKNRELTSELKSMKEKFKKFTDKGNIFKDLKDLEKQLNDVLKTKEAIDAKLQVETKARIEVEKFAVAESKAKAEAEKKLLALQDTNNENTNIYCKEKLFLENQVQELLFGLENLKLKSSELESLKEELSKEKERSARYKKNYAAVKNSLKGKNQEQLNEMDKSEKKNEDNLDESCRKCESKSTNSFKYLHSDVKPSKSTTEGRQRNTMEYISEKNYVERRDIQNIECGNIMDLLLQINLLKAELEQSKKSNEQLTNEITNYETHFKTKSKQVDPISSEGFMHSSNEPVEYISSNKTEVNKTSVASLRTGSIIENDMISSSESLLHSRVVQQLGGALSSGSRLAAEFSCIQNEVPVRDIDTEPAFRGGKVPPDFQSSNEEIQTIIACTGNVESTGTYPISAYSSPDLGIESDPNRDRDWSRSPLNASSEGLNLKKQIKISSVDKRGMLSNTSTLTVLGRLGDLVLLNKEVEESSAILQGIKARIIDRIRFLSEKYSSTSPAKNLEYSTLKELDSSCFNLQVCLDKSTSLISAFWIDKSHEDSHLKTSKMKDENGDSLLARNITDAEKTELYRLRKEFEEQSKKLKDALSELAGYQRRKEKVDKAISKQLSKTKHVLRKAKGNLLDEQKDTTNNESTSIETGRGKTAHVANDNIFPKHVASTPMVKSLK